MRLLPAILLIPSLAQADIVIEDAWIQDLPATVPMRAGYLQITNSNAAAARIVGLHGEAFTSIEMHRSLMKNGTMQMEPVAELVIEAGDTLRFEPGGLHLMMYPEQQTRPGDVFRVVVEFGDGESRTFDMVVRR